MPSYRGYRFLPEIIAHAVWVYHRFGLSVRDVEDLLAERGITVTYETIRQWCLTCTSSNQSGPLSLFRKRDFLPVHGPARCA